MYLVLVASLNPLANGLLAIFSFVIWNEMKIIKITLFFSIFSSTIDSGKPCCCCYICSSVMTVIRGTKSRINLSRKLVHRKCKRKIKMATKRMQAIQGTSNTVFISVVEYCMQCNSQYSLTCHLSDF